MKKLGDFQAKKVELKTVYGGRVMADNTFSCNTITIYSGGGGKDDGSDEAWDK